MTSSTQIAPAAPHARASLLSYQHLLFSLTGTELKLRYRRSALGFAWSMLNPMLMMGVLTVVFSSVMRVQAKDYAVLLLSGILPWTFFAQSVTSSLMSIVNKGSLIKKVYIPKAIIPLSAVLANLVNFMMALVPFMGIAVFIKGYLSAALLFLPVSILIIAIFATGIGFIFASLNVYFRDFSHMTDVLLQALFYASPVIYTAEMLPENYRWVFDWNPLVHLLDCFRSPIYYDRLPTMQSVGLATMCALASLTIGSLVFRKFQDQFVLRV